MQSQTLRSFGNCATPPDGSHLTLIGVLKGGQGCALNARADGFSHVASHLHGNRGDHGQHCSAVVKGCRVTDSPDTVGAGHAEKLIDNEASAGPGDADLIPLLGSCHAGRPDNGSGRQNLTGLKVHIPLIHTVHGSIQNYSDTEFH